MQYVILSVCDTTVIFLDLQNQKIRLKKMNEASLIDRASYTHMILLSSTNYYYCVTYYDYILYVYIIIIIIIFSFNRNGQTAVYGNFNNIYKDYTHELACFQNQTNNNIQY
jgi:hypothetical protein